MYYKRRRGRIVRVQPSWQNIATASHVKFRFILVMRYSLITFLSIRFRPSSSRKRFLSETFDFAALSTFMRKRFIVNLSLKLLVVFMLTGFAKIAAVNDHRANIIGMESRAEKSTPNASEKSNTIQDRELWRNFRCSRRISRFRSPTHYQLRRASTAIAHDTRSPLDANPITSSLPAESLRTDKYRQVFHKSPLPAVPLNERANDTVRY